MSGTGYMDLYKWGSNTKDYFPWTIETDWSGAPSGLKVPIGGNSPANAQKLHGDVVLNGGWTNAVVQGIGSGDALHRWFGGNISGEGSLIVNQDSKWAHFAGTNTTSGALVVTTGYAVLENTKAMPQGDPARVALSTDTTAILLACAKDDAMPHGFESSDYYAFSRAFSDRNGFLYPQATNQLVPGTLTVDGDVTGSSYFRYRVYKGSAKFTSSWSNNPSIEASSFYGNQDTVILTAGDGGSIGGFNRLSVTCGRAVFENAGYVLNTNVVTIGSSASYPPRLVVGAGSTIDQPLTDYNAAAAIATLSLSASGKHRGILEVTAGGCVTNWLVGATGKGSVGSTYVRAGGVLFNTGRPGRDVWLGNGVDSLGYLEIDGGEYSVGPGYFIGGGNVTAAGIVYMKGGTFVSRGTFGSTSTSYHGPHIGREGQGLLYQTGGVLTVPATFWIGSSFYRTPEDMTHDGYSVCILDGAAATARVGRETYLAGKSFGTFHLCLNDGATLETRTILRPLVQPSSAKNKPYYHVLSNRTAYVAFNGGRLRAGGDSGEVLGSTNVTATYTYLDPTDATQELKGTVAGSTTPDYVTVYAAGAILDVSNYNVTVQAPLVRPPTAGGIASISIPGGTSLDGYLAPPIVDITGDGQGAVAVALFDSTNSTVTGVKVIAQGWGYTAANTTVRLRHGHRTPSETAAVTNMNFTVADNAATGGLTLEGGSGTLTLAAANTYGGATRVNGGTLKIAHASALPAGTSLVIGDGVVDMNGHALGAGTTVAIADPAAFENRTKSVTLMTHVSGPVTVTNADELPPLWSVGCQNGQLRANYNIGTMVIFR